MAKRDLKKYLSTLTKEQIEEQFLEVYDKFKDVRVYYDFVFNPQEEKLSGEAKAKILNEYFPIKGKRARMRRSVAQKYIKHFALLGVDPFVVNDIMLYSIETAQKYSAKRSIKFDSFYMSMLTTFVQALKQAMSEGIFKSNRSRFEAIAREAERQSWQNAAAFVEALKNAEDSLE